MGVEVKRFKSASWEFTGTTINTIVEFEVDDRDPKLVRSVICAFDEITKRTYPHEQAVREALIRAGYRFRES